MALPKSIQRQADQATAVEAEIAQQISQQTELAIADLSQLAPANDPASAAPQITDPMPPVVAPVVDDWQQKYRSLLGRHAKETGELHSQVKTHESQMALMQKQVETLMQTRKQDDGKEKASADPKDIENFGADMIEMVKRYAEQVFQSMADQFGSKATEMDGRIAALEDKVTGVSNRTEVTLEQQFYATLNTMVPDWEQINQGQRWLEWLAEIDPVYGVPRQAALDTARSNLDVQRVAHVFNAFKQAHPAKVQSSLANQVAPNGAAAPAPVSQSIKPVMAAKAVEKFYSEVAKGRYVGRETEAAQIEAEINQAAAEGRIR